MQFEQAYNFLIPQLENGLPSYITYHDVNHTKGVIAAAEQLAREENISGDDLVLLKTAALFHDAGFLQSHEDHEDLSCKLAKKHLPAFDYTEEQIEQICTMIMATRLPQTASDMLSQVLCDADLFYLGSKDYKEYADKLYKEFRKFGIIQNHTEWELKQADFISLHKYFTNAAIKEREEGKQKNLADIRNKIDAELVHHKSDRTIKWAEDTIIMLIGVLFAGIALKGFLVPNHFFDGGITGISLLTHEIYHFNLGLIIIVFNLPLILIGYFSVGGRFAYRMLGAILLLGICLELLPSLDLTADKLLIAVFGGAFLGIGIGMVMRAGGALDGIEVLAIYTLKRTSFTITEIILAINIIIFTIAGFQFGIETALYSILTYFTATRSINYVVEGIQAYTGVTIISGKSEAIKYQLVNKLGRGITVYKGERGFLPGKFDISSECDIIFTVITRLELRRLKNLVYEADPNAFVFASTIKEASGGVLKRRHSH